MAEIKLISYIPGTGSYKIFYPEHFSLNETDDGIVTITSPETYSNLTISGYQASLDVDEKVLTDFFQEFTQDYTPLSEIVKEIDSKRLFLERRFERNKINWIWWGLAEENQIILFSANSDEALTQQDYNLYKYMIDQMEIYPSPFEE